MSEAGLGRRTPTTWEHVERYPLSAAPDPDAYKRTPIVLGINWYSGFDHPVQDSDGRWWIGASSHLGAIEGGHAILVDHPQLPDRDAWWHFYNQGSLGACVGFSLSRALTQFYKTLFDPVWLWNRAKATDEWSDTNPGDNNGTSIDAAARILSTEGHVVWAHKAEQTPSPAFGVGAYRWARSADEILESLDSALFDSLGAIPLLNSWGEDFQRVVWIPLDTVERLLDEGGEACVLSRHLPSA